MGRELCEGEGAEKERRGEAHPPGQESSKLRIVADTNILVSSVFWMGKPRRLVQMAASGKICLLVSEKTMTELRRALVRDFNVPEENAEAITDAFLLFLRIVEPRTKLEIDIPDKEDIHVLECAVDAKAEYVVSGDKHLLSLNEFRGIPILTVAEMLEIIG